MLRMFILLSIICNGINAKDKFENFHQNLATVYDLSWPELKAFYQSSSFQHSSKQIDIILLIFNDLNTNFETNTMDKDIVRHVFKEAAYYFYYVINNNKLINNGQITHLFFNIGQMNKELMQFLKQLPYSSLNHFRINENGLQQPIIIARLSNRNPLLIMNLNNAHFNIHQLIFWLSKVTRINLLRYLNSTTEYLVKFVNIAFLLISPIVYLIGYRINSIQLEYITVMPLILFPSGYLWNQLHGYGNDGRTITVFNIFSINTTTNSQHFTECYLVLLLYLAISSAMYNLNLHPINKNECTLSKILLKSNNNNNSKHWNKRLSTKYTSLKNKSSVKNNEINSKQSDYSIQTQWACLFGILAGYFILNDIYNKKF